MAVRKKWIGFVFVSIALTITMVIVIRQHHPYQWRDYQKEFIKLERQNIAPISMGKRVTEEVLNTPVFDFIAPWLNTRQIVLKDVENNLYFSKINAADRCTTCHLAIDRKGFEDAPEPFRTHPRLDLFLASDSKHSIEKVGCTVCHGGNGQSVSFDHSAHTPRNEHMKKEWEQKYHWQEEKDWEEKMLPLQYTEASCVKCHTGVVNVPEAPKLNAGRTLARENGCFGCHVVKGEEQQWKVGPNLTNVHSKLDREWIIRWLQNPKEFRASTKMPYIFHQENTNSPKDRIKSNVAIEGIAEYLIKQSEDVKLEEPLTEGSPAQGQKLVRERQCFECHSIHGSPANDHGPELSYLGSKVTREWLFSWLKNPKHYSLNKLPNPQLTDEEAGDITSYLLKDKNPEFETKNIPINEEKNIDEFTIELFLQNMNTTEARVKLKEMNRSKKMEFIGQKMIDHQGCFSCHDIRGFEDTKRIGPELSDEGRKQVEQLDFGGGNMDHTRQSFFHQKLTNSRVFDRGKIKDYLEKLRMPNFDFNDEEADSLTTFLLSLREDSKDS